MSDFQLIKAVVRDYYDALSSATIAEITGVVSQFTSSDYRWRGVCPFYEHHGAAEVAEYFWMPLRRSFTSIQRREDVFFAGKNATDRIGGDWVCSMGHLMALFDHDWLGIPPTGKIVFLPYVDFHRITGGKIVETASFFDILSVMRQAGQWPLPPQTGAPIVSPGPRTHNGILYDAQDPEEGSKTLKLIERMIDELVASDLHSPSAELSSTWHHDMCWFGPAGIGATFTLERYELQHQQPFAAGLSDFEFAGHDCLIAEGSYGGIFGLPSLLMKSVGGFMGMPGSDRQTEMRLVDIYRREGDKLAENWIFIDILHFLSLQGLNVLDRIKETHR